MMTDKRYGQLAVLKSVFSVMLGNFLYACTVQLFLVPSGLVTGGTTGIALAVNKAWGVPVPAFVFAFNTAMLLLGFAILGKAFALTTLASTVLYPVFLEFCGRFFGDLVLTQDMLLCAVFSGVGIGAALGIVLRSGASTGGMDIPPLVLKKLFGVPVSVSMYVFDVCILLLQAMLRPVECVLYGVILVMIYTVLLDKMLLIGSTRTEVKIVSSRNAEIADMILSRIDRGVTLLDGEGGYMHDRTQMVLSVISNRELIRLERLVHEIDPECFMVVSRVSEVRGRGFSMGKHYR